MAHRNYVMTAAARSMIAVGLFGLCSAAEANVVCLNTSPKGGPLRVRPACKPNETQLGDVTALQALFASSASPDGGTTLQLTGNIQMTGNIQIATPITGSAAHSTIAAEALPGRLQPRVAPGDSTHFCTGGTFPGELGNQSACTTNSDCNNICVAGENSVLGGAGGYHCTTDSECNTALMADGRCSLTATCEEFAVLSIQGSDLVFSNYNVHVRSGSGATDGAVNGRGNLIIGYDKDIGGDTRTGSHNLVVGDGHTYASYGGFVAGYDNAVTGPAASVSGGLSNVASGPQASISGGSANRATGQACAVSGGEQNLAGGPFAASVGGGFGNVANAYQASVSGGESNTANGTAATVSGGASNSAGPGFAASVSGGENNAASGEGAAVSGGFSNAAGNNTASVSGGHHNTALGIGAAVSGGESNSATGTTTSISGGESNIAESLPNGLSMTSTRSASVSGGLSNIASAFFASVSGGLGNVAGVDPPPPFPAFAAGYAPSVSAGYRNRAYAAGASVTGGGTNTASGDTSSVSGGASNNADGLDASVSGGVFNNASGPRSSISGGNGCQATGVNSSVSGGLGAVISDDNAWHAGSSGPPFSGQFFGRP